MDYRIKRFGIASTALTVAMIYFVLGLIIAPLVFMVSRNAPADQKLPGLIFVLGPFFYAVFGYVFAAIGCWLYNIIAGWTGGVALTLEPGEA
ncbi:MAG TPA: hypothetical protein VGO75_17570 [Gemmatimonadaceae bacterium]|nr:hypothetical protein [Gemmatimonadaceae bacterium]